MMLTRMKEMIETSNKPITDEERASGNIPIATCSINADCNIGIDDTFVNDNSGSDTLQVHQYINMTSPSVLNVYEDLNAMTADPHKYETLYTEGMTAITL